MIEGSFLAVLSSHTIFSDCTLFLYDHAFFGKKYANEADRLWNNMPILFIFNFIWVLINGWVFLMMVNFQALIIEKLKCQRAFNLIPSLIAITFQKISQKIYFKLVFFTQKINIWSVNKRTCVRLLPVINVIWCAIMCYFHSYKFIWLIIKIRIKSVFRHIFIHHLSLFWKKALINYGNKYSIVFGNVLKTMFTWWLVRVIL